ncbi:tyrosine-type recombinase/integrase [Bradyrhizobium macuxiense]|uniref:tyrosine-type recombinase/integrase n=1 Tax=Bradyrhizobium macuxiense TaxID=1755647 RepID=UPI000B25119D|nr:tyrosine-type recombinase/integrase [Bradyrhizobium macuxiense]
MTDLRSALDKYLSMRKGLGYKYEHQTRRLADFIAFMEKRKARIITTKLAMEWATLPPDRHASWALRLSDVRGFARHVANFDPRTEVSPVGMLPGWKRAKPYVYSDAEIDALLAAALALPPADGLRRWTYHTLFGLIAVTGMRISEAMGLERDDVDLDAGVLTVRLTKFGKSRLVPLHPTTRPAECLAPDIPGDGWIGALTLSSPRSSPSPLFTLLPLIACWRYEPREHL